MKFLLAFIILSLSLTAMSSEVTNLPKVDFDLATDNALQKIDDVLLNPEDLLQKFQPAGAIITKKSVDRRQLQFYAKKTVLFITKNVFIHSYFDVTSNNDCQGKEEKGYLAQMDFAGSDALLTDNVEKYEAQICVKEVASGKLHIQVRAKLLMGNDTNIIMKPIISDIIAAQTGAIILAIKKTCLEKN